MKLPNDMKIPISIILGLALIAGAIFFKPKTFFTMECPSSDGCYVFSSSGEKFLWISQRGVKIFNFPEKTLAREWDWDYSKTTSGR